MYAHCICSPVYRYTRAFLFYLPVTANMLHWCSFRKNLFRLQFYINGSIFFLCNLDSSSLNCFGVVQQNSSDNFAVFIISRFLSCHQYPTCLILNLQLQNTSLVLDPLNHVTPLYCFQQSKSDFVSLLLCRPPLGKILKIVTVC